MSPDAWPVAVAALRLSSRLVEAIQAGVAAAGFGDVRPVHGFAFVRIAAGGATTGAVAADLGVSKQAAAQLVARLVERGYVRRAEHPADGRAALLELTDRGWACTQAAQRAAAREVDTWRLELSPDGARALEAGLLALTGQMEGIRPAW